MAENITGIDKLQLGRQVAYQTCRLRSALDPVGLLAQKDPGLHRLAQGVDGGVGHLGGVDEDLVPVDRKGLGVAHRGQQHAAAFGLLIDLRHGIAAAPVGILLQGTQSLLTILMARVGQSGHTAVAVHAFALVR